MTTKFWVQKSSTQTCVRSHSLTAQNLPFTFTCSFAALHAVPVFSRHESYARLHRLITPFAVPGASVVEKQLAPPHRHVTSPPFASVITTFASSVALFPASDDDMHNTLAHTPHALSPPSEPNHCHSPLSILTLASSVALFLAMDDDTHNTSAHSHALASSTLSGIHLKTHHALESSRFRALTFPPSAQEPNAMRLHTAQRTRIARLQPSAKEALCPCIRIKRCLSANAAFVSKEPTANANSDKIPPSLTQSILIGGSRCERGPSGAVGS